MFVSEADAASFRKLVPEMRIAVIANGVDTDFFAPAVEEPDPATIVFEGSMDFQPNTDAAVFLCRDILPRIRRRRRDARVVIVGRTRRPRSGRLASRPRHCHRIRPDVRPTCARQRIRLPAAHGGRYQKQAPEAWEWAKPSWRPP